MTWTHKSKHLVCLQAVRLLKRGGVLVYSTCTVTLAENEEQVAWALDTFPCLTLQPQVKTLQPQGQTHKYWVIANHSCFSQEPHIGGEGMLGAGLSPEQLRLLQRFSPELSWDQTRTAASLPCRADGDTIGFFIAKFLKNWPEGMFSLTAPSALTRDCRREQ